MPRRNPAIKAFSVKEILGTVASELGNPKPNIHRYNKGPVRNEKQIRFHHSDKQGRLYVGGNRSGKTVGGVVEDIWWLTGKHPYLSGLPEPPIYGRLCTVDFKTGWNRLIQPVVKQWLPPSELINGSWEDSFDKVNHVLTLENGSELEIMSYDQDLEKFAGVPRHFTHFDEEPSRDIYNECLQRLVDYNGRWWMTMTPLEGMDWTYDVIYLPSLNDDNPLICVVEVEQEDNPFINQQAASDAIEMIGDSEQSEIRHKGKYVPLGGLVFTNFDRENHLIYYELDDLITKMGNPKNWAHWESYDHGFGAPAAWIWHAVHLESGVVITYDMHYAAEMLVKQHAAVAKERRRYLFEKFGIETYLAVADPAIEQRQGVTGLSIRMEYAQEGIYFALNQVKDVKVGLNRMNTYFMENKWFINDQLCHNLTKEIMKYRRKRFDSSKVREKNNAQENPVKKDDHAIDSSRYFFSYQPVLNPDLTSRGSEPRQLLDSLLGAGTSAVDLKRRPNIDWNLLKDPSATIRNYDPAIGEF